MFVTFFGIRHLASAQSSAHKRNNAFSVAERGTDSDIRSSKDHLVIFSSSRMWRIIKKEGKCGRDRKKQESFVTKPATSRRYLTKQETRTGWNRFQPVWGFVESRDNAVLDISENNKALQ